MKPTGQPDFFLPYQARWIKDGARLKLMEKARQIGLSWSTSYGLVRRKAHKTAALDAWVSSRDDIQARLFLEDCKSFAGILHVAAHDLGERVIDERKNSAYVLEFANALRIHSMSSNPDAQAGKRGDRILDEFALHPDPRKLYSIAYPGITWGGQFEVISTHRGSANYFNELVNEIRHKGNPKGFSLHRVTLQDALDQGFLTKLKAKLPPDDERAHMDEAEYFDFIRAGCSDEESFLQEYMCQPADDNSAFLSYDLIASCEYQPIEILGGGSRSVATVPDQMVLTEQNPPGKNGFRFPNFDPVDAKNPLYIGVDVGRDHDLTVIWVLEKFGGVAFTRLVICMQNQTFDSQESTLYPLLELPQVRRCCIDNTGLGRQFAERAQQRFGTYKIEPINFTGPVKEELAYPMRAAFEDRTIRIPNDDHIRADLRSIKKVTTAAGNVRFAADRGKNGHADRFWAAALALHAGKTVGEPGKIYVFDNRRTRAIHARRERTAI